MTTAAQWAKGCVLTWAGNPIAELTAITPPVPTAAMLPASSHDSPSGIDEFVYGMINSGKLTVAGHFIVGDTNGQIALMSAQKSRTIGAVVLTFPAAMGASLSFNALIESVGPSAANHDGVAGFTATLQVTGDAVFAATPSNNITVLAMSNVTLTPAFDAATYDYIGNGTAATTAITATFAAGTCDLYRAGALVASLTSTVASAAQSLGDVGDLTIFQLKVKETGKTEKIYTIRVGRDS
jgi:hypothetical protein